MPGTRSPVEVLRKLSGWPVTWLTCFDWTTLLGMAALTAPAAVVVHPAFAGPGLHGVISAPQGVQQGIENGVSAVGEGAKDIGSGIAEGAKDVFDSVF